MEPLLSASSCDGAELLLSVSSCDDVKPLLSASSYDSVEALLFAPSCDGVELLLPALSCDGVESNLCGISCDKSITSCHLFEIEKLSILGIDFTFQSFLYSYLLVWMTSFISIINIHHTSSSLQCFVIVVSQVAQFVSVCNNALALFQSKLDGWAISLQVLTTSDYRDSLYAVRFVFRGF